MDKIRSSVTGLPDGWVKEVVVRKSGASAGKSDVYYYSPEGKKCRSKPQMMQYLPEDFDLENFDFRAGENSDRLLRKRKRRKDNFNFGKDFHLSGNISKPARQTKKSRESLPISIIHNIRGKSGRRGISRIEMESKRRRAESQSQRYKPKQLFWQNRLQNLKPSNEKTERLISASQLETYMKNLLPGSNNQGLLNSLWHSLFISNKVTGQHASLNALRKHPTALVNADQPFTAPFTITEDVIRDQEKKVEAARRKLCEAQELLKALEEEDLEIDDLDEL